MDGATSSHMKALIRVIKYVEKTKDYKLVLDPGQETKWEMKAYTESDFAGDADNRKSISGFVIYLNGCPLAWRSKQQNSVMLSSTEAEYVAVSEVAMEIICISKLMEFMDLKCKYSIVAHVNNMGAIYMTNTDRMGSRTKHIDTRYHYVRNYIKDGILNVMFVQLADNKANLFTKNLGIDDFKRHTRGMFSSRLKQEGC